MPIRTTHTVVLMEVSETAYREVREILERAGYDHAFLEDGALDMSGIALVACGRSKPPPAPSSSPSPAPPSESDSSAR